MAKYPAPSEPDAAAVDAARLDGARIAARGIAHCLNNDLAGALGNLSVVLAGAADLSPEARDRVERAAAYLRAASSHLNAFERVQRLVTRETPDGPMLELARSLEEGG
jgi:hypothetical protein